MSTCVWNGGIAGVVSDIDGEATRPDKTSAAARLARTRDLFIITAPAW
jgi:hypothetical protein